MPFVDSVDPGQFEEVISEAKAEGNLSRRNLMRKAKGQDAAVEFGGSVGRR